MRCRACDCELTDHESTLKDPETGQYEDMCLYCLGNSMRYYLPSADDEELDLALPDDFEDEGVIEEDDKEYLSNINGYVSRHRGLAEEEDS